MRRSIELACVILSIALSGCALTSKATNFNGLKHVDGAVPVHITTTKVALHFGIVLPFIGDATLDGAVEEFTKEAI